ncbi:MAG: carbon storage regulator [Aureliella sp.]
MLVLSRKAGEKLVIGDNITVEVVKISGNRITLGIVAPPEIKVLRSELKEKPAKPAKSLTISEADVEAALVEAFRIAG